MSKSNLEVYREEMQKLCNEVNVLKDMDIIPSDTVFYDLQSRLLAVLQFATLAKYEKSLVLAELKPNFEVKVGGEPRVDITVGDKPEGSWYPGGGLVWREKSSRFQRSLSEEDWVNLVNQCLRIYMRSLGP